MTELPRYQPELFKRLIKARLSSDNPVTVTFTKENGESRVMKCTWNLSMIPSDKHPHSEPEKDDLPYARVFDLDKGEWRSFIWENVTELHPL